MKESIKIRNLGPLKKIEIDNIPPLTILIGESGSGKSLLMKAIVLMRFIFKRINVRSYLKYSGIKRSPFRLQVDNMLHDDLKTYLYTPDAEIEYTVTYDDSTTYQIVYKNKTLKKPKNIDSDKLLFLKESWISETRNVIPSWISNSANIKGSLGYYFHETLRDFEEAISTISSVDMSFIKACVSITKSNGKRRIMLSQPGKHDNIELRHASSGMQTAAPLAVLTHYFANEFSFKDAKRRSVLGYLFDSDQLSSFHPEIELAEVPSRVDIHVEEPELSLDPTAQVRLIDAIVNTAFTQSHVNDVTMMLATHSPYIVNALNLVINRQTGAHLSADDLAVFMLKDGQILSLKATTGSGNEIVDTSDLTAPMEKIFAEYQTLV